ncbi:related to MDM20 |uniref:Related to MDM20 \|nr:related to MDM20 \
MAAFNPLSMLAERTCAPIYSAIDTGNAPLAIKHADRILAAQPTLSLASALKTIALIRTGKKTEASKICDELLKRDLTKGGDDAALHPLTWSLSRLGRGSDEVVLLEKASKAQPSNEDLARQAVTAMIKHKQYQKAQQTSFKMHKSFDGRRNERKLRWQYFWWSIQSYILLSRQTGEPAAALALPLCERMIANQAKTQQPLDEDAEEELALQLSVLNKLGKKADAFALLSAADSPGGKLCQRSLSLEFLRRELAEELGEWNFVKDEAQAKLEGGSRNWAHVLAFIQASTRIGGDSVETSERASDLIARYFETFGSKPCCHEDVLPYLMLVSSDHRAQLSSKLESKRKALPVKEEKELRWNINISKLQRSIWPREQITLERELGLAADRLKEYLQGLEIGKDLPDTEMQPADDLALLACQSLVSACHLAPRSRIGILHRAVTLLEFACGKSKKGYQLRMLLIRCYLMLGCYDRASIHYNLIGIKVIQNDTLSHLISDRVSTFGVSAAPATPNSKTSETGFKLLVNKAIVAAEEIYDENSRSTPEMVVKCLEHGTFSRVEEFVDFGEMVERSIQRQVLRLESARSKRLSLASTKVPAADRQRLTEEIASLTAAVKLDLDRGCHDQRDFSILPNFQPLETSSIIEQTSLGPIAKTGWLKCMHHLHSPTTFNAATDNAPTEADRAELSEVEGEMYDLVTAHRQDKVDELAVDHFFSGTFRPSLPASDPFQTYSLVVVLPSSSTGPASKAEAARSHLVAISNIVDDHIKATTTATTVDGHAQGRGREDVFDSAFASSLDDGDKVRSLIQATRDNTSKSLVKILAAYRDALGHV